MSIMKCRPLGRTGIQVSEIGFGAWGIGGLSPGATSYGDTDDFASQDALRMAFDLGVTFFETSCAYGNGHSEELIGHTLNDVRDKIILATKAGITRFDQKPDFSPTALQESLNQSLERLKTDHVELLQLHNPSPNVMENGQAIVDLMDSMKAAGTIRAFGVSLRSPEDGLVAIEHLRPDTLQANFNLLDRRAIGCGLFQAATETETALIARTPLCFGFLSGGFSTASAFDPSDHRSRWPQAQITSWTESATAMLECMDDSDSQSPARLALRFCLSFSQIATTIPGMLIPDEVRDNVAASALGPLSADELERLRLAYEGMKPFQKDASPNKEPRDVPLEATPFSEAAS